MHGSAIEMSREGTPEENDDARPWLNGIPDSDSEDEHAPSLRRPVLTEHVYHTPRITNSSATQGHAGLSALPSSPRPHDQAVDGTDAQRMPPPPRTSASRASELSFSRLMPPRSTREDPGVPHTRVSGWIAGLPATEGLEDQKRSVILGTRSTYTPLSTTERLSHFAASSPAEQLARSDEGTVCNSRDARQSSVATRGDRADQGSRWGTPSLHPTSTPTPDTRSEQGSLALSESVRTRFPSEIPGLEIDRLVTRHGVPLQEGPLSGRPGGPRQPAQRGSPEHWATKQLEEIDRIEELVRRGLPGSNRPQKCRGPRRQRMLWSRSEIRTLIRLWLRHGNSWAYLKEQDELSVSPQLGLRTQVDLKDKMRNIKLYMRR